MKFTSVTHDNEDHSFVPYISMHESDDDDGVIVWHLPVGISDKTAMEFLHTFNAGVRLGVRHGDVFNRLQPKAELAEMVGLKKKPESDNS